MIPFLSPLQKWIRWRLDRVRQELHIPELALIDRRVSPGDGFAKYLFASADGASA